jgi:hypothetical protein
MFPLNRMILIACMVSLLAACGGGGDSESSSTPAPYIPPATYGSIYTNRTNGGAGIVSNYPSQAAANEAASAYCVTASSNTNCQLSREFGPDLCGALYRSANTETSGKFGSASASTAIVAEANAFTGCKNAGGTNCLFAFSACNGSGSPSSRSVLAYALPNGSSALGLPYEEGLGAAWQTEDPK